jgi:hypothetical protein
VYKRTQGFKKLSDYAAELESALKTDAYRPKPNRRTGRALFAQLKASGYERGTSVSRTSSVLGVLMLAKWSRHLCR